ncbi:MAG: HU family DNA-binding protein, partial [Bacteroidaceae bacterium]|nr:HU family DNA-binding protein [Bacteroidaceae bacterium]
MDNKLNIQDLALAFSEANNMDLKSSIAFVKSVFEIVEEYVTTEKLVKIKGFGTFKLISMIVPYGPLGCYSRLVYLINKYRVSLKNCVFMNMDEYLTPDGKYIDKDHPFSFRGGMDRIFYNLIDEELNVLPENRYFPDPEHPEVLQQLIDKYGVPDMTWGGIGINGHFAFNEPPEPGVEMTNEEFANLPTRVL